MLPTVSSHQSFDCARERQSFAKRRSLPHLDDQTCDSPRSRFFAEFTKETGQFLFVVMVYDVGSSQVRLRVHAHVQRTVPHEAKTALRVFELARRNTQIKERPAYGANAELVENPAGVPKIRLPHDKTAAETRESFSHVLDCIRILIQRQNLGATFQQLFGMATTTTGSIHDERARSRFEQLQHFPLQNWTVIYNLLHRMRLLFASARINGEPGRSLRPQHVHDILTKHMVTNRSHLRRADKLAFPPRAPVSSAANSKSQSDPGRLPGNLAFQSDFSAKLFWQYQPALS